MKNIYDANMMGYINLFETMSRVKVKDAYIREGTIVFIIEENGLRKALGRNGSNIKRLVEMIKKKIKTFFINFQLLPYHCLHTKIYLPVSRIDINDPCSQFIACFKKVFYSLIRLFFNF